MTSSAVYAFRRLNLVVGAAPKTGCTSILRFLTTLDSNPSIRPDHFRPTWDRHSVHHRVGTFRVDPIMMETLNVAGVAIVRDPAKRIASAWVDKILSWQPLGFELFDAPWFPKSIRTVNELDAYFMRFAEQLTDHDFRQMNWHWAPYVPQYLGLEFTHLVATEEIARLPQVLVSMQVLDPAWQGYRLQKENASSGLLVNHLARLLRDSGLPPGYEADEEWFQSARHITSRQLPSSENVIVPSPEQLRDELDRLRFASLDSVRSMVIEFKRLQVSEAALRVKLTEVEGELANLFDEVHYRRDQVKALESERQVFLDQVKALESERQVFLNLETAQTRRRFWRRKGQ